MLDPNAILIECRVEYAVGSAIILLRFFARWKIAGWRGFYWDDFFAFSSWVFFTMIYAMEQREALPPATRKSMREGAKAILKGCIIILFLRFTRDTPLYRYVQIIGGVSIAACIAALITQTTHCLPMKRNWQILPDPGKECSAGVVINIVIAVGNVLVDALLLVVPLWMLKDSHIRLWRKIRIVFLLSLGLFVMGMATARCILSIGTSVQVALASVWAQREAIVSIFAVNAPVINGLFRAETWATRKHTSDYSSKNSRTYPNPLHKKKKSGFEIYKMTDFETKMSDMETTRAESIVDGAVL
ncbi:hypothetical protein J3E74DRAFT_433816 [Bipolaris maydis]|nr:hypothetical protein J3E74DRAFT_433816 [Bipolaris maydis]